MRKFRNKITKITRILQHKSNTSNRAPIFWHVGVPNFGDDINPWFFGKIVGDKIKFASNRTEKHFMGMGSILERSTVRSTVLGSGILAPLKNPLSSQISFVAVRGDLTAESARCDANVLLGDPLVLLDQIINLPKEKKHTLGIIPHVSNFTQFQKVFGKSQTLIDPSQNPLKVLEKINACTHIASQSLHGLIVADALKVPNVWLAPSHSMFGGEFKFHDYFSTLNQPKEPLTAEDLRDPPLDKLPFAVGVYKYDKKIYLEALHAALEIS